MIKYKKKIQNIYIAVVIILLSFYNCWFYKIKNITHTDKKKETQLIYIIAVYINTIRFNKEKIKVF